MVSNDNHGVLNIDIRYKKSFLFIEIIYLDKLHLQNIPFSTSFMFMPVIKSEWHSILIDQLLT